MRILVIGLDCAAPEILLEDERLTNFRRLMEMGCYGPLETVVPPITVPAWMCMATSADPGSLGVYGFRNRKDHTYAGLEIANSRSIRDLAIWDQVAREGKKSCIIGVPPNYPPRKVNGVSVGCFMTPDPGRNTFTHPADAGAEIARLCGEYPVDVKGFRTDRKEWLREQIFAMTRTHFQVVRHFLREAEWDYFQFVEIGLDRVQHGFWKYHDPQHRQHEPGNPYENVIRDYYLLLDEEVGRLLELLDEETTVLVVSDHGAKPLDGGFCINEWLVRKGLLVLDHYPERITPFAELDVDWQRTKVWGEGGYYARIFLNVKGREPHGAIDSADYDKVRDDLAAAIEALEDDLGEPMHNRVFRPEETYRQVRNVAPDLLVHFGDLSWRSIGGVGYSELHVQENDTGPDDCNHAQLGSFILAGPGNPLEGRKDCVHLLDIAPTLLEIGGYDVPEAMQGRSLIADLVATVHAGVLPANEEEIIRQRLQGLGYI